MTVVVATHLLPAWSTQPPSSRVARGGVAAMPAARDAGQEVGQRDPGNKDRDLQVLLQELCQLQAKYELSRAPLCPGPAPGPPAVG